MSTPPDAIVVQSAAKDVQVLDNALDVKASRGPADLPFTDAERRLYGLAPSSSDHGPGRNNTSGVAPATTQPGR
jgi:hypothetical protein